jgi:hypothetical protein
MPADLHTEIRDALHADDITASDLRYPDPRSPGPRRTREAFAIAGAVAAVAVVAVALTVAVGHRGERPPAGGHGSLSGVVGYRWQVVRLVDSFGALPVPASLHAQIGFAPNGYVLGNDTVNALQGTYRITGEEYAVRDARTTLVGVGDVSQQRKRTIAAVDAMFSSVARAPSDVTPRQIKIIASLRGQTLTLRHAGFTLILHRAGVQQAVRAGRPSSTPTKTG